jgi:hypothetical protein
MKHEFSHHKKQQQAASYKPVVVSQLMVKPTNKILRYKYYQTTIFIIINEVHPQP